MSGTESSDEEQESLDWRTRLATVTPNKSSNSTVPSTAVGVGAPSALDLGPHVHKRWVVRIPFAARITQITVDVGNRLWWRWPWWRPCTVAVAVVVSLTTQGQVLDSHICKFRMHRSHRLGGRRKLQLTTNVR